MFPKSLAELSRALLLYYSVFVVGAIATKDICPPYGPVLPAPKSPSTDATVRSAMETLGKKVDDFMAPYKLSAVSMAIRSIHEELPMMVKSVTPPITDANGTKKVDEHTIFRVGSISKAITMLAILKLPGVSIEDPVTKYLPELKNMSRRSEDANGVPSVAWEDITLSALAEHLSGVGQDFAPDISNYPINWTSLGLRPVHPKLSPNCAGLFGIRPCNKTDFLNGFNNHDPIYDTFTSPVYSNIGYSILGFVVESVAKVPYEDFVRKEILEPLGMKTTAMAKSPGPSDKSFIVTGDPYWGASVGFEDPSGAFYSTANDILAFGSGILESKLLSEAATRKWLKPKASLAAPGAQLGDVWEIYRSNNLTSDKRLIEIYTKSGDLGAYHAMLALVPDYDLVISILTAGPGNETSHDNPAYIFSDAIIALLPALESAGRAEAARNFAGTYFDPSSNSTLVLGLDDGPGLNVASWVVRGVDYLANYARYYNPLGQPKPNAKPVPARLYPTNVKAAGRQAWRAVLDITTPEQRVQRDSVFWEGGSCNTWGAAIDRVIYQHKALDEMVFTINGTAASSVRLPAFGLELTRTKTGAKC